uniref:Uncharacterized protein n=1 Tax=Meloidogyne enterolobii TaxID=390850 RepID=A0A6V7V1B7_MELEN|nr:unnamed protein product [Meloidogyne enterolobii]
MIFDKIIEKLERIQLARNGPFTTGTEPAARNCLARNRRHGIVPVRNFSLKIKRYFAGHAHLVARPPCRRAITC